MKLFHALFDWADKRPVTGFFFMALLYIIIKPILIINDTLVLMWTPIKATYNYALLRIDFAREKKYRRQNYNLFRNSVKDGDIDDFESNAKKVIR